MSTAQQMTSAFSEESRKVLRRNHEKILHCLKQLSDEDVNWRPFPEANSIGNIVTHLCGNMGQWILSAVGGAEDRRNRPGEFARDLRVSRRELIEGLTATVDSADRAIAGVTADSLLSGRKIQGYDETVLGAIYHAISHFEGHTHQIVYITRLRLGDRYAFKWVPATPDQISAGKR